MSTTTPALIGHFAADCRSFLARRVRMHGQPTRTLRHLAAIYSRHPHAALLVTNVLMAHDWAEISIGAWPCPRDPRHERIAGFGFTYRARPDLGLVGGDIVEDQPWRRGEWAYLWEHDHGALHVYIAAAARWHHLATVTTDLLPGMDGRLAADVEARSTWLEAAR